MCRFCADLSYCAVSDTTGKHLPNSNVLIELGFAFAAVSDRCVLNVMNVAYGKPDELPFDLKHKRWPIQYDLDDASYADTGKRKEQAARLKNSLRDYMRPILEQRRNNISKPSRVDAPSMKYIAQCLATSDPGQDWDLSSTGWKTIAVYRDDIHLSLEVDYSDDGIQAESFVEPWANRFPNSHAVGYWVDVRYAGGLIPSMRSILVSVDGGR